MFLVFSFFNLATSVLRHPFTLRSLSFSLFLILQMFSVLFLHVKSTGHNDTSLVLPFDVLETLRSETYSPKEVVDKLIENRQLERSALEQPEPETRKWIRCLASNAKDLNRPDVVKYLREITPAGTTGRCDTSIVGDDDDDDDDNDDDDDDNDDGDGDGMVTTIDNRGRLTDILLYCFTLLIISKCLFAMLMYLSMTLGLSLGLDLCLLLCFYIFAQSVKHSSVSFCFLLLSFRGGEDTFF